MKIVRSIAILTTLILGLYCSYEGIQSIFSVAINQGFSLGILFIFVFPIWLLAFGLYCIYTSYTYLKGLETQGYRDLSFIFWFMMFVFTISLKDKVTLFLPNINEVVISHLTTQITFTLFSTLHHFSGLILNNKIYTPNKITYGIFCLNLWLLSSSYFQKQHVIPTHDLLPSTLAVLGPTLFCYVLYKSLIKYTPQVQNLSN